MPGGPAVKDSVLSLLWLGFDPWLGNFHMPWVQQKKKKKEEEEICTEIDIFVATSHWLTLSCPPTAQSATLAFVSLSILLRLFIYTIGFMDPKYLKFI